MPRPCGRNVLECGISSPNPFVNDRGAQSRVVRVNCPSDAQVPLPKVRRISTYHRYVLAHQRDMGGRTSPCAPMRGRRWRTAPRPQTARRSGCGAGADLSARRRNLLATVPLLLARRFAHPARSARKRPCGRAADDVQHWLQPGAGSPALQGPAGGAAGGTGIAPGAR